MSMTSQEIAELEARFALADKLLNVDHGYLQNEKNFQRFNLSAFWTSYILAYLDEDQAKLFLNIEPTYGGPIIDKSGI